MKRFYYEIVKKDSLEVLCKGFSSLVEDELEFDPSRFQWKVYNLGLTPDDVIVSELTRSEYLEGEDKSAFFVSYDGEVIYEGLTSKPNIEEYVKALYNSSWPRQSALSKFCKDYEIEFEELEISEFLADTDADGLDEHPEIIDLCEPEFELSVSSNDQCTDYVSSAVKSKVTIVIDNDGSVSISTNGSITINQN